MPQLPPLTFEHFTQRHLNACLLIAKNAPDPWRPQDVAAELKHPARVGYVAIAEPDVVGFAFFTLEEETALLSQMVVEVFHRGEGVGTALLSYAIEALRGRGIIRIILEVRTGNTAALALYRGLGFEKIASRPALYSYPTEDGYTLQKVL